MGRRKSTIDFGVVADLPGEEKSVILASVIKVRRGTDPDDEAAAEGKSLVGTPILRRTCKPADMELSFSLFLKNRTFDIQCFSREHFDILFPNLVRLCAQISSERRGSLA